MATEITNRSELDTAYWEVVAKHKKWDLEAIVGQLKLDYSIAPALLAAFIKEKSAVVPRALHVVDHAVDLESIL